MLGIRNLFCDTIAIDLGTVNTLLAAKGKGILLREPSAVALGKHREVLAVGNDAVRMLGRTPGSITVAYPLRDGVIADPALTEEMLRCFIGKTLGRRLPGTGIRAVICVPGCITDVERHAVEEAAKAAGAKEAYLMDEPVAAALGAGLPVQEPVGSMVVDIGGGTTDAAVLALAGVVTCVSVRSGGTHMDDTIADYVRKKYSVAISRGTAEQVKCALGTALPGALGRMEIRGRDLASGLPRMQILSATEVYEAIQRPLERIYGAIQKALSNTPPELSGDLMDTGILLTGGGAKLEGLAEAVEERTGIPTRVAESCMDCTALGALVTAENLSAAKTMKHARAVS